MKFILLFLFIPFLVHAMESGKPQPLREISIIVTKEGYYPRSLSVFEGEKVKFYVTSTLDEPHCMIVEGHKVFLAANKGKVTEAEATFDKSGEFAFYCPTAKSDGKIVVMKKVVPKREMASERSEAMVWTPKEY
jgi:plastocyanin